MRMAEGGLRPRPANVVNLARLFSRGGRGFYTARAAAVFTP